LTKYSFNSDSFKNYNLNLKVADFIFEKNETLLLATNEGVKSFNINKTLLENKFDEDNSLSNIGIRRIFKDNKQTYWYGTSSGLYSIDLNNRVKKYEFATDDKNNDPIYSIYQDIDQNICVGTRYGFQLFNAKTRTFHHYKSEEGNLHSISQDLVISITQDRTGIIWIGTLNGLNKLNLNQEHFNHFSLYPQHSQNPNSKYNWAMIKDRNDNIWMATSAGVFVYNEISKEVKNIQTLNENQFIYGLHFDQYNNLIATGKEGNYYIPNNDLLKLWDKKIVLKNIRNDFLNTTVGSIDFIEYKNELWLANMHKGLIKISN